MISRLFIIYATRGDAGMTRWSGARFYFLITSSNETCARLLFQLLYLEMETDSGLSREMVVTKRITFITQLKVMSHFPLPLPLPSPPPCIYENFHFSRPGVGLSANCAKIMHTCVLVSVPRRYRRDDTVILTRAAPTLARNNRIVELDTCRVAHTSAVCFHSAVVTN